MSEISKTTDNPWKEIWGVVLIVLKVVATIVLSIVVVLGLFQLVTKGQHSASTHSCLEWIKKMWGKD